MVARLEFSDVSLAFANRERALTHHILKDARASLEVAAGEVLGVLGESGSGKSTLLRLICGELEPDSGSLEFSNVNRSDIILLPQGGVVLEHLSISENLELFSKLDATKSRYDDQMLRRSIDILDIGHLLSQKKSVAEISGGERQRISLARVLSIKPSIVLLDEPCAAIGGIQRQRFLALLKRSCVEAGYGAVIASHDWRDHQLIASNVVFVRQMNGKGVSLLEMVPVREFENDPQHAEAIPYTTYAPVNWLIAERIKDDFFAVYLGEQQLTETRLPGLGSELKVRLACGPFEYGSSNRVKSDAAVKWIGRSGYYEFLHVGEELAIAELSDGSEGRQLSLPTRLTAFSTHDGHRLKSISLASD